MEKISVTTKPGEHYDNGSTQSAFQALADLLLSLTNNDNDGRIIISKPRTTGPRKQGGYIKYVMLSGEKIFSEVRHILMP